MKKNFSVSGRTELAGNHTDHQNGRILASTVHMGLTAKAEGNSSDWIRVKTQGYGLLELQLNQLSVRPREFGSPIALVRGVAAAFALACLLAFTVANTAPMILTAQIRIVSPRKTMNMPMTAVMPP